MSETFDFAVADRANGKVTLVAKLTSEGLASLGQSVPPGQLELLSEVRLVLDESTGFPGGISVGGQDPILTMDFDDFRKVDPSVFPPGAFSYAPPPGASVMDLGAALGAQAEGGRE
jgi:hypothetical protein